MSVSDKIKAGDYESKIPYPTRPTKPRNYGRDTPSNLRQYADELEQYEAEMVVHREEIGKYHADENRLHNQFKRDLEEENGIPHDHPKAGKIFSMAWEHGHSSGLSNVLWWYDELSELVTV